jgi:hypothetical protein
VFAKVHLGYKDGRPRVNAHAGAPIYGQIHSEKVSGVDVLHLWPYDFPMSAREGSSVEPLATLWRPTVSGVFQIEMAYSGLERLTGESWCWVAQRWLCLPLSFQDIKKDLDRSRQTLQQP